MNISSLGGSFIDAARRGPLVLDGAMGTQLYERGILYSACFEELNISRPAVVTRVHEDYVRAGAQIIETNTFGANALRLEKHGLASRVVEFNRAGVALARSAADGRAFVVGAIGPSGYFLGEASAEELAQVKRVLLEQARSLVDAGVDALFVETMRQSNELQVAIEAALEAAALAGLSMPVVAMASLDENRRMADGTSAGDIALRMVGWGASVVGANCSDGPMTLLEAAREMIAAGVNVPIAAAPNAGLPRRVDERLVYVSTPEYFGVYARRMLKVGVTLVGGCCGTTPEHVRRIASAVRMMQTKSDASDSVPPSGFFPDVATDQHPMSAHAVTPVPVKERSQLGANIGRKFIVSVEVNPPIGLDTSRAIAAAKMLKSGGVNVINIADGARAQARMSNLVMAARIEREVGIETILHVCGRDRNLLGTLAHLLGAHDLGLRNLVVITGDPPKMGDFPDATPVYDLDSIGILKLATRLNHGVDPAGKPLGGGTKFVLATGAEPASLNYDREIARLQEKKNAGAELVMTQPVYDPQVLVRFLKDIESLNLPILLGLLPLASFRNAEFLHNEVPGMRIPDSVRERMRKAGSGEAARQEGVKIAREMLGAVHDKVAGVYVMPPLERYELALEVVDGFASRPVVD